MSSKLTQDVLKQRWAKWEALWRRNPPTFEGLPSEDVKVWLEKMERSCPIFGIPESQWIETAVYFLRGTLKVVMKEAKEHIESNYKDNSPKEQWRIFKDTLQDLHKRYQDLVEKCGLLGGGGAGGIRGGGRGGGGGEDPSKPYLDLAAGGLLIAGSSVILPSLGVMALNVAGFTAGGVAAGSLAAAVQSVVYGASTGGVFSVLQSIGATAVIASPLGLVLGVVAMGVGLAAMGAGLAQHNRPRDGDSDNDEHDHTD